jgi:hypothetical protein
MALLDFLAGLPTAPPPAPPPPDPNGLAAQLMGLGSIDQRHKLLEQQYGDWGHLAQGAPIDYSKGKGTPLLLAGLANLVSAGVGGYQQGKTMQGLRSLVDEGTTARKSAIDAATSYAPPDVTSLSTASDAAYPAKAAEAQNSVGAGRRLAMALAASGDPSLAAVGKQITSQADTSQEALQTMPQTRLDLQKRLRAAMTEQSPVVAGAGAQLLKKLGLNVPEGATAAEVEALAPIAEKVQAAQKPVALQPGAELVNPVSGKKVAGGGNGGFDDAAIDALAKKSIAQGSIEIPKGVRGAQAYQLSQKILGRMLEIDPNGSMAEHAASNKADSASLLSQQKILDNAESWENTGKANLKNLLAISQKLANAGSPWLNKPVREFLQGATGDTDTVAFKAAHNAVVNEYAKILSGAAGSGTVTDSARHEAESMIPLDATPQQMAAAAAVLNTDADNRIGSARQQVADIKARLGGGAGPAPAAAPAKAEATVRKFTRAPDGKLVEVK